MNIKEAIVKLKTEYNIVDYIRSSNVNLKKSSPGVYESLCPFHSEKTPSFKINEEFQNYKCFGCGAHGDIISYAQHIHSTDFVTTVKMLAAERGWEIDDYKSSEPTVDIASILHATAEAASFYHDNFVNLHDAHPAKVEITKRGLSVDSEIYGFALEAPNALYQHLHAKGFSDDIIKETQLVMFYEDRKPWDFFHGRLLITLSDYMGRPVTFTSRKLYEDDKMPGKYVNGKDSVVFHKKKNLFGLHEAKRAAKSKKEIIVVEGQFDQISMMANGYDNVVATSGTAFTQDHANTLKRLVDNDGKIIFVFDGDSAGIKAATAVFKEFNNIHSISHAVILDEGSDPCDYIKDSRANELDNLIQNAKPLHHFVLDRLFDKCKVSNKLDRNKFVTSGCKFTHYAQESIIVSDMLNRISILSATPIDTVRKHFESTKKEIKQFKSEQKGEQENAELTNADKCMIAALSLLIRAPHLLIKETPKRTIGKYKPFILAVHKKYKETQKNGNPWRFIAEEYPQTQLASLLIEQEFLGNFEDDPKGFINQYKLLYTRAVELNDLEKRVNEKANSMSAIVDMTDPKEIANAFSLMKK